MAFKKLMIVLTIAALFLSCNLVVDAETGSDNLAANEAVVTNFAELKAAISEDNGIDTVYLGADVELSGGIIIPASKKTFTLSGKNPATGEIHTLTETMASSGAQSSVITVNTNTGTKETTLKDINVIGKNYYGTISVYGAAKDVVQNYENVHYQG
ncbi:putative secreted protein, partial [Listeria innocua FSL S4-378]